MNFWRTAVFRRWALDRSSVLHAAPFHGNLQHGSGVCVDRVGFVAEGHVCDLLVTGEFYKFHDVARRVREVVPCLHMFFEFSGRVRAYLDTFGCIGIRVGAFGCFWTLSEHFGVLSNNM